MVNNEPQFRLFLQAKRISSLQKLKVLTKVFGKGFDPFILELIAQLSGPESVKILNEFNSSFEKLVKEYRNIIYVKATVAEVLKKDEISKLSLTLKSVLGEEIKLKVEVDTRIIGGIKLRVEDVFLDGSINSQLQGLRNKLLQI
jgi:F-type H+-transporting ATPase subunit delta